MTAAATATRRASVFDRRIAQLRDAEREYTRLIAEACEAALAAPTSAGYERESRRANALESVALRLAEQRRALERQRARCTA